MAKIHPLSGFPEWLPQQRIVELEIQDEIRRRFELYGFAPLETRSVEPLSVLVAKGETDKEIYVVDRLAAGTASPERDADRRLGLHYDLTVPFARYVVQHYNELDFPFKRYQIQRGWRGERPQEGRYREFVQADIDVIDRDRLALSFDAEMVRLLHETLAALPIPPVTIAINNRKITEGYLRGLDVADVIPAMRILDKLDKIGADGVRRMLDAEALTGAQVSAALELVTIAPGGREVIGRVEELGVRHALLDDGLAELAFVMDELSTLPAGAAVANMAIVRGFDYYTGSVYEGSMRGHEDLGAVCSGGRYENLAAGARVRLPGVGVSIGVSRIVGRLFARDLVPTPRKTPTEVLVLVPEERLRWRAQEVTHALRERGIPTEMWHEPSTLNKQLRYADNKGIPYAWLPGRGDDEGDLVRDMVSGDQGAGDPSAWLPATDRATARSRARVRAEERG